MLIIHVLFMVLGAWRITEIVTQEVIFEGIRQWWARRFAKKRYGNFLTCSRCVSVWAGGLSTSFVILGMINDGPLRLAPFMNWPFAISMLFLINAMMVARLTKPTDERAIKIFPDQHRIEFGPFGTQQALRVIRDVVTSIDKNGLTESVGTFGARNGGR